MEDATADDGVFADRTVLDPLVESEKSFPEPIRSESGAKILAGVTGVSRDREPRGHLNRIQRERERSSSDGVGSRMDL